MWFVFRPRTSRGARRVFLGSTLGSIFRTSIDSCPSHCLSPVARRLVFIAACTVFAVRAIVVFEGIVVEVVNGGRALISSLHLEPSPLSAAQPQEQAQSQL